MMITNKESYNLLLNSPKWNSKRSEVLTRDNNTCRNCGSDENLQVHHKQYHFSMKRNELVAPWEYHNSYLITLCQNCHREGHNIFKIPVFKIN